MRLSSFLFFALMMLSAQAQMPMAADPMMGGPPMGPVPPMPGGFMMPPMPPPLPGELFPFYAGEQQLFMPGMSDPWATQMLYNFPVGTEFMYGGAGGGFGGSSGLGGGASGMMSVDVLSVPSSAGGGVGSSGSLYSDVLREFKFDVRARDFESRTERIGDTNRYRAKEEIKATITQEIPKYETDDKKTEAGLCPGPDCDKKGKSKVEASISMATQEQLAKIRNTVLASGKVPKDLFLKAWDFFSANLGKVKNRNYLAVVDYRQRSDAKRLYLVDLRSGSVTSHLVSHGVESSGDGPLSRYAVKYSNKDGSHQSSHGAFLTGETFPGKYKYSLRLDGMQSSNSKARSRALLFHPKEPDIVGGRKFASDTWGCFGLEPQESRTIIDKIKGGAVLYVEPYRAST